ncbi:hypothetical protein [Streptosporangium pseudovulgare]|uniref:Sulfur reduction protein DsrE n=1 Tax=Streptosporangium pseudovulgare TaxID=35765 RepID=A0ABQ2R1P8_9ACTN|nr:hypothetical protein [Streptosporangium pseudovulgare]GGQ06465.1 hypothetical protein GCM10010140_40750 [Streptosporangium pseudovulgare]
MNPRHEANRNPRQGAHLLIETRGPWEGPACARFLADAVDLARGGDRVCVLLLQDGVTAAVGRPLPEVETLVGLGAGVWVDRFSVEQRALSKVPAAGGTEQVEMDRVAALLLDPGVRVVWH